VGLSIKRYTIWRIAVWVFIEFIWKERKEPLAKRSVTILCASRSSTINHHAIGIKNIDVL
jgi:hypothetical protein